MTDTAALPFAQSDLVAVLVDAGWLDTTISAGQAFGAEHEAITVHSALLAARHVLGCDVVVVAQGPGNAGSSTTWGWSGLATGDVLNAVHVLRGRAIAVPRVSASDARERHLGLSHHTTTVLSRVLLGSADVVVPDDATDPWPRVREQVETAVAASAGSPRVVPLASTDATDDLARALTAFDQGAGLRDRQSAAAAVLSSARRLEQLLAEAPAFADRAQQVIRSVETRRSAVSTRSAQLPDTLSALRREFSADCSLDLQRNGSVVDERLEHADAELAAARAMVDAAPDQAIGRADAARDDLAVAEKAVDAVLDRLRLLREVRADPRGAEQRVRFRLRDAQLFAVNHRLVDEWGSVLDAQADRIERAEGELDLVV